MNHLRQTVALVGAMAIGLALPGLSRLDFLIRPLVMLMLGLSFLRLEPGDLRPRRVQWILLALPPALAALGFFAFAAFDRELAYVALLVLLAPTATAAPVVAGLLGGKPGFVAQMVLATNVLLPLALAGAFRLVGAPVALAAFWPMLGQIVFTIGLPLAAALAMGRWLPAVPRALGRWPLLNFGIWVFALALICATAGAFVRQAAVPPLRLAAIAGLSAGLCALNFSLGRLVGGRRWRIEAGQSLGQKNTLFGIWAALSFVSPLAALGPACYVLWHNLYNAWQLSRSRL